MEPPISLSERDLRDRKLDVLRSVRSLTDAEFRNRVEHLLEPGHSAVVIMASKITEDKFASAMQPFGGTILKTSLSESDEKELTG
jgi:uncharacterized membrane protein